MKFSFPTVVTLITVLVSASAESTFLRGDSMNHEDGTNFNHRALSAPLPPPRSCYSDGTLCVSGELTGCSSCCNGSHMGPILHYCGPDLHCWGKDTYCVPFVSSCDKCCNSWSWYVTGAYCD